MRRPVIPFIALCGALVAGAVWAQQAPSIKGAEDLFRAGKWKASQEAFEKVLTESPDAESESEALLRIGYCQERQNQWEAAIATYRQILDSDESTEKRKAQANLRTGYSMRRNGQNRAAIPFLLAAAENEEAEPNTRAEGFLYTAWAYGVLDEKEEALKIFRKVETVPEAHRNLVATAYLNIGGILQKAGKYEEALAAFKRIAEFDPVAATNRSRARIHILECEALLAGDNPFHIKPCVVDATETTARLFWVSQGETPPKAEIRFLINGAPRRRSPDSVEAIPGTICHKHFVELTLLKPGAQVDYLVESAGQTASGSFRTAPEPGSAFSFSVIGDTQSYAENLQPLLDALGEERTDFVIHVGDLVDKGDLWGEWKAGFFDPGWSYLQHSILRPAFGNHDGGPFFPAFFKTPEGKVYYSFDWGDAHFVVLDSYGSGSGGAGRAAQLEWLEKDLAANEKPWTIVSLHVPMVATRSSIKWFGKDDFLPILEKHGVDLVFSGHHPLYRRYRPIGDSAILHITSGGGGGPVGGFMPSPILEKGVNANHYCRVEVEKNRLRLTAKDIEGKVIDQFELTDKDGNEWRQTFPWQQKIVDAELAKQIAPLYQELLTDRTFELVLRPEMPPVPGEKVVLTLDLAKLPRGPLDVSELPPTALVISSPPESAWKFKAQDFIFGLPLIKIEALAPETAAVANGRVTPDAGIVLELRVGQMEFESFETKARLVLPEEE